LFVTLKNFDDNVDIKRTLECREKYLNNIKTSIKNSIGYYKLKQHKASYDKDCAQLSTIP